MANPQKKAIRYEVFGPFPFRQTSGERHRETLKRFWTERLSDGSPDDLCDAVGVYVWTYRKEGKRLPWNVGLTSRQGFKSRFVQKETSFLRLTSEGSAEGIEVYLLALKTKTGRFRKATTSAISTNDWLETMLIGSAIATNSELRNSAKVQKLKNTIVDGYLNDENVALSTAAKSFSKLFKA